MKDYIKLIRVKHWLKNGLVFLPLFFSLNLFNWNMVLTCFIAFICFSLSASIVYVINDINDVDKDRKHPVKKNRPLASGAISIKMAYVTIAVLVTLVAIASSYLFYLNHDWLVFGIPLIYIFVNILYSFGLKNVPIIDVVILVSGFVMRVMYGGVVIDVAVSKFLYLMVIFGAFFLGFGKRRNEIIKNGKKSRSVLALYNKEFLDKNLYVSLVLSVVSYSLWCVDTSTINRIGNDYLFWTIPIIMVVFQLYSLDIEGDSHGDPIEVILSNKILIAVIVLYMLTLFIILYVI